MSYWQKVEEVLARVAELIPSGQKVVVLADRAYGNPAFIDRVGRYGWDWLVRVQGQSCFEEERGWSGPLKEYLGGVSSQRKGVGRLFKKQGWRGG